VLSVGSTIT